MTRPSLLDRLRRMNQRSLFGPGSGRRGLFSDDPDEGEDPAPASDARAEAIQRLQVGLFGIGAMVLLVGLASIIGSQADLADEAAVPDAAPTTEPTPAPTRANPLADAGVVPDIDPAPVPSPSPTTLDLPPPRPSGSGNAAPSQ
ncbi:MAG: hypothetical protein CVT75_05570 [Alphaproteobacteria bacterium HGW-Alphaproteobacteria-14]|nr:MAG: hypothetical protein CVT75_05570 [Alphaproteobacteria bacterium HGW-Alphaproteobacteria-14]